MIKEKIVKVTEEKSGKCYVGIPVSFNVFVPKSGYFKVSPASNGGILLTPV